MTTVDGEGGGGGRGSTVFPYRACLCRRTAVAQTEAFYPQGIAEGSLAGTVQRWDGASRCFAGHQEWRGADGGYDKAHLSIACTGLSELEAALLGYVFFSRDGARGAFVFLAA